MNYELAEKLKDAGFPGMEIKFGTGKWIYPEPHTVTREGDLITHGDPLPVPTLSELIAACWKHPRALHSFNMQGHGDMWSAQSWQMEYYGDGSTPEEAVANLYLFLNQK